MKIRPNFRAHRIDRAAREVNPFLIVLAIGLMILYLTCLVGLLVKLPVVRVYTCAARPSPATESVAQHPLPTLMQLRLVTNRVDEKTVP